MTEFPETYWEPEAKILGLTTKNIILNGQVGAVMPDPLHIRVMVKDVHIMDFDSEKNVAHYKTLGERYYQQRWDLGGSYLDPDIVI